MGAARGHRQARQMENEEKMEQNLGMAQNWGWHQNGNEATGNSFGTRHKLLTELGDWDA
jgi:hypothetical protein